MYPQFLVFSMYVDQPNQMEPVLVRIINAQSVQYTNHLNVFYIDFRRRGVLGFSVRRREKRGNI